MREKGPDPVRELESVLKRACLAHNNVKVGLDRVNANTQEGVAFVTDRAMSCTRAAHKAVSLAREVNTPDAWRDAKIASEYQFQCMEIITAFRWITVTKGSHDRY